MSSIFTSLVTSVLDVPGEPGQTITIRKLAPKHLIAAHKAHSAQAIAELQDLLARVDLGGSVKIDQLKALIAPALPAPIDPSAHALVEAVATRGAASVLQGIPIQENPLDGFDCLVLMQHGTIAWSYFTPEISRESLEDLGSDTVEWLSTNILKLAKPSLFESESEAAVKNV